MSIFSRAAPDHRLERLPFMPTQAPTGSTSRSRELTAILARAPGSRALDSMRTNLLVDLGDLLLEQLLEQALVGARQDDLRVPRALPVDIEAVRLDSCRRRIALARHLSRIGNTASALPMSIRARRARTGARCPR